MFCDTSSSAKVTAVVFEAIFVRNSQAYRSDSNSLRLAFDLNMRVECEVILGPIVLKTTEMKPCTTHNIQQARLATTSTILL